MTTNTNTNDSATGLNYLEIEGLAMVHGIDFTTLCAVIGEYVAAAQKQSPQALPVEPPIPEAVLRAGQSMANICFNLSQFGDVWNKKAAAKTMREAQEKWDAAVRASRSPVATAEAVPADIGLARQWDHIDDVMRVIDLMRTGNWHWGENTRCKYVELRIDTRDGGCIIKDREGNRITPAELAAQPYGHKGIPWEQKSSYTGAAHEAKAKKLYESWSSLKGYVPWVDGGNSLMQDEARRLSRPPAGQAEAPSGAKPLKLKTCDANREGDCKHAECPQLRDGEPTATGRHCPLDNEKDERL